MTSAASHRIAAHNPRVVGSNPAPATKRNGELRQKRSSPFSFWGHSGATRVWTSPCKSGPVVAGDHDVLLAVRAIDPIILAPRRPPALLPADETIRFAVEDWHLEYGLHLWDEKPMSDMERGWESISVVVSGPLLKSKMRRRIRRVELGVLPANYDPNKPQPHWKGIGSCRQASGGVLRPSLNLPFVSFHTFVAALAAQKVRALEFDLYRAPHGISMMKNFSTVDPDAATDG